MQRRSILKNLGISLAFVAYTSAANAANEIKIATVDMQRALQTVASGKQAKAQLEKEFNLKKNQLQTEENAIKKMSEELRKQSLALSDKARAEKQGQVQERIMKFQDLTARSQAEIQQKERDLTKPIIEQLRAVIADIAKDKNYTVVLEKNENTVLYSQEKDDLTNDVITIFDKQSKSNKSS